MQSPRQRPSVGRPAEAGARWITEHEDDPEEESPQSDDETAEKFAKLHDAEAEGSAVLADLKTHRQVQCGGRDASTGEVAGGDQLIQAHLTKVTYTVTARQALVEGEPEEDDIQNAQEVIAAARADGHQFEAD